MADPCFCVEWLSKPIRKESKVPLAKILVIDDEPSIHNVVTAYLKAEGYEFQSAMDGPAGRSEETDKIVGLSVGADDYLTKPFSPRELIARIKAALRRMQSPYGTVSEPVILNFAHLRIDLSARRVWVGERLIELTAVEFDLLVALAQHHSMVLSREQLLEKAWDYDYFGDTRVVDVHVGHIRQKLGDDKMIETIRGVGYRFEDK